MTAGDAAVTLKYAASNTGKTSSGATDEKDATSMGLVIGMGGATLTVAQNTLEIGNGSAKYEAGSAAIAYAISDTMTVEAYSGETENDKNTNYEVQGHRLRHHLHRDPGHDPFGHPQRLGRCQQLGHQGRRYQHRRCSERLFLI